jgi:hypothetical protein
MKACFVRIVGSEGGWEAKVGWFDDNAMNLGGKI